MVVKANFSSLRTKLQILAQTAPEAAKSIAKEFAGECVSIGKQGYIPKRTGNMRSTARVESEANSVKFVVGGQDGNPTRKGFKSVFVDYAIYVNNGTSRQAPQFFMERIVARAVLKKNSFYNQVLSSWLKRV